LAREKSLGNTTAKGASPNHFEVQKRVVTPFPTFRLTDSKNQLLFGTAFSKAMRFFHHVDALGEILKLDQDT
jgi:hypothetical protein